MRLSVRHTTRYRFSQPVVHALQRVRLTPKETQGQSIEAWEMRYANAHEELRYEDQHHNTVVLIAAEEGAEEVSIECEGVVETTDHAGIIGQHSGHLPLWSFLSQTRLTRPGPKIREMLKALRHSDGETLDQLHALSQQIRTCVPYIVGATDSGTTAEEAFTRQAGVCQDHAQIFVGAARVLDVPARYVSGYLMMDDRVEQDATHAWAEAFVKGLGWVGFDVSNGISPDARYVRVATGRDYRDAAPIAGVTFGASTQELEVDVAVKQQPQMQQQ